MITVEQWRLEPQRQLAPSAARQPGAYQIGVQLLAVTPSIAKPLLPWGNIDSFGKKAHFYPQGKARYNQQDRMSIAAFSVMIVTQEPAYTGKDHQIIGLCSKEKDIDNGRT